MSREHESAAQGRFFKEASRTLQAQAPEIAKRRRTVFDDIFRGIWEKSTRLPGRIAPEVRPLLESFDSDLADTIAATVAESSALLAVNTPRITIVNRIRQATDADKSNRPDFVVRGRTYEFSIGYRSGVLFLNSLYLAILNRYIEPEATEKQS